MDNQINQNKSVVSAAAPVKAKSSRVPFKRRLIQWYAALLYNAHLKGFIFEDEANFIAIIACMNSSEPFFRYSGFILAYDYLSGSFPVESGLGRLAVDERVIYDDVFISDEKWVEIEKSSPLPTSVVKEVSDKLIDNSLKINGVEEGIGSYGEVVTLLLHYFLDR